MVSIAFRIRVTQVKNANDLRVELAAGIVLRVTNLGRTSSWANALNIDAVLAASLISTSSGWVDVVMLLTAGGVTLWESSGISFSLSEYPGNAAAKRNGQAAGNAVRATFFVELLDADSSAQIELTQISVTAATDSPVPLLTRPVAPRNQDTTMQQLGAIIPAITTAAAQLAATLTDLAESKIGPWELFFGYEPALPPKLEWINTEALTVVLWRTMLLLKRTKLLSLVKRTAGVDSTVLTLLCTITRSTTMAGEDR